MGDDSSVRRLSMPVMLYGPTRCIGYEFEDGEYDQLQVRSGGRYCPQRKSCIRYRDRRNYGANFHYYSELPYDFEKGLCLEYRQSWVTVTLEDDDHN